MGLAQASDGTVSISTSEHRGQNPAGGVEGPATFSLDVRRPDRKKAMSKIEQLVFELDGTSVPVIKMDGKFWLSQKSMAALFQIGVPTLHAHVCRHLADGSVERIAFGTSAMPILHYSASIAISIANRVMSPRGLAFIERFPVWAVNQ